LLFLFAVPVCHRTQQMQTINSIQQFR